MLPLLAVVVPRVTVVACIFARLGMADRLKPLDSNNWKEVAVTELELSDDGVEESFM